MFEVPDLDARDYGEHSEFPVYSGKCEVCRTAVSARIVGQRSVNLLLPRGPTVADTTAEATVREFLRAWSSRDFDRVGDMVAEDVEFVGPGQTCTGRTDYLTLLSAFADRVTHLDIHALIGRGEEVMTFYTVSLLGAGDVLTAERFVLSGGLIRSDQLVFDTGPAVRAAAGRQQGQ